MLQPRVIPPPPKFELWQAVRWYADHAWIVDSVVVSRRYRHGFWDYTATCGLTLDEADLEAVPEIPPRDGKRPRRPR